MEATPRTFGPASTVSWPSSDRGTGSYTVWQSLFLRRLNRLVLLQRQLSEQATPNDWERRLLSRAIYSTYCDCLAQNIADDARQALRQDSCKHTAPEGERL